MTTPVAQNDVVEMVRLLRQGDELTSVLLLEAWANKQRLIGAREEIARRLEQSYAQA